MMITLGWSLRAIESRRDHCDCEKILNLTRICVYFVMTCFPDADTHTKIFFREIGKTNYKLNTHRQENRLRFFSLSLSLSLRLCLSLGSLWFLFIVFLVFWSMFIWLLLRGLFLLIFTVTHMFMFIAWVYRLAKGRSLFGGGIQLNRSIARRERQRQLQVAFQVMHLP